MHSLLLALLSPLLAVSAPAFRLRDSDVIVVPEPATLGLMGLASLCMLRRRR